ncbi:DUF4167 domain-containing protein [Bosea sp. (in: a-proteobacteria)]|jgi:hypothetical protein|uniref:DUF4167 domain-containing protein n=1 Tax=Bosea sp. (in: a-proteobacteria) TaxID=1871050 RepID=UPI002DDD11EF|nr:DUF4167 domain-containing protein [Bosea sp. (in: a-proteobacteria)]HEV2510161.1 DUF4167 domain-containing protein [Bosea sp. (in: a-proteobacteria)]
MTERQTRPATIDNRVPHTNITQARRGSSAQANYERYLALAKAKALAGDRIEAERCYQYAEHYLRMIRGTAA